MGNQKIERAPSAHSLGGPHGLAAWITNEGPSYVEIAAAIEAYGEEVRVDILDGHGILHGEAATAFVAEMERVRSPEEVAKHNAFMKECEAVYRKSLPGRCQRCDMPCLVCAA